MDAKNKLLSENESLLERISEIDEILSKIDQPSKALVETSKDIASKMYKDGFIPFNVCSSVDFGMTTAIGNKYAYNKEGKVINRERKREVKVTKHKFRGVVGGVCYEFYMPLGVINVKNVKDGSTNSFKNIKQACRFIECSYITLKKYIGREFGNYLIEIGWPEPHVVRVVKKVGGNGN